MPGGIRNLIHPWYQLKAIPGLLQVKRMVVGNITGGVVGYIMYLIKTQIGSIMLFHL